MKVLLVSPNTEQTDIPTPPLGLWCVAEAALRAGHDVLAVDLMHEEDIRGRLIRDLETHAPEIIGVSIRNIDDQDMHEPRFLLDQSKEVIKLIKARTNVPVVLGGAGYSMFPESALSYLGADMGIRGDGEEAFTALLARMEQGRPPAGIPGFYLPGAPPANVRAVSSDLDLCPLPAPEHFHVDAYDPEKLWMPVQTRRGCPIGCAYCSTPHIEGRLLRKRRPDQVIRWLKKWKGAGFSRFHFVDNTFNLPPSYAETLCDEITTAGLEIQWLCILYPGAFTDRLAEKMRRSGCRHVSLGFESGSPRILKSLNKRFTPKDVLEASRMLRAQGIQQMGFLLLGGPGETRDTVEESLSFIERLDPDLLKITIGVRIYPETPLARHAVASGFVSPDDSLLFPRFYLETGLEEWVENRVESWLKEHPKWNNP